MKAIGFLRSIYLIMRIASSKGTLQVIPIITRSFIRRFLDLLRWYLLNGEVLFYYHIFGFDSKSQREQDEYISRVKLDKLVQKTNKLMVQSREILDYRVLTYDKFVANNYLTSLNIPCAYNEALIMGNEIIWPAGQVEKLGMLMSRDWGVIFIKPAHGMGGEGIIRAELNNGQLQRYGIPLAEQELEHMLEGGIWVVQREVVQHPELNRFNSSSVHCIRLTTIMNGNSSEFISSFIKISTGESIVDNWGGGSVLVGIDHESGTLLGTGYYKPKGFFSEEVNSHPDSDVKFKGFPIPFYQAAVDLCLKAHIYYYGRFILGWDVAITPEGPVIIEVNCRPSIHAIQMLHGGVRKRILHAAQYFVNRNDTKKVTKRQREEVTG